MKLLLFVSILLYIYCGSIAFHIRSSIIRKTSVSAQSSCMKSKNIKPPPAAEGVIELTDKAKEHFNLIRKGVSPYCVRIGVRKGGCSGMSYTMDVIDESKITPDDHLETIDDIKCVIDPKSMLYIYGLQLDYSDALIGGGFKFSNPNANKAW